MYFENTNYAISHLLYDSKLAIAQLRKLMQCTKAGITQPRVSAQHNATTQSLSILKENSGDKTTHALKNKAWTNSKPCARVSSTMSLQFSSAGKLRGKHLQRNKVDGRLSYTYNNTTLRHIS